MNKEKIIEVAKNYFKSDDIEIDIKKETIERENAVKLINYLEDFDWKEMPKDRLINFNILERSSDCDYWLEAAAYADLKNGEGSKFITIIFSHEFKPSEDFDDLMEDIFDLENEAQKVLKSLDPVRYVVKLDN